MNEPRETNEVSTDNTATVTAKFSLPLDAGTQHYAEQWRRWHEMERPPTSPGGWLQWACAQFPALYDAPQPLATRFKQDLTAWAKEFDNWGRVQSRTITAICAHILAAYNSNALRKSRLGGKFGYKTLADAAKNWDADNRRGMARLILQAQGI